MADILVGPLTEAEPEISKLSAMPLPRRRGRLRLALLFLGPLLVAVVGGYFWLTGGRWIDTDNAYLKADMAWIATEVPGRVVAVLVHDNERVKQGQPLFRIDPRPFAMNLERADANLTRARSAILALEAGYRGKEAQIDEARADLVLAQATYSRDQRLLVSHAVPQSQLDEAQHARDVARAQLAMRQEELADIVAGLDGDPTIDPTRHSRYRAIEADRERAALDLTKTLIRAPGDGVVTRVAGLQVGDYVDTGKATFALVSEQSLWVEANYKETLLTNVRAGQPVTVTVDTYPGHAWQGRVGSISPSTGAEFSVLPPENATGNWVKVVQRIPVRIEVDQRSDTLPLRAGMSASVAIDTGQRRELPGFVRAALALVPGIGTAEAGPGTGG